MAMGGWYAEISGPALLVKYLYIEENAKYDSTENWHLLSPVNILGQGIRNSKYIETFYLYGRLDYNKYDDELLKEEYQASCKSNTSYH